MNEIWKPVVGYEEWYEVSNLGRVRRIKPGHGTFVGKLLSISHRRDMYCSVGLTVGAATLSHCVHVLVCRAFNGPPPTSKHQVNHKDGIKYNNFDWNLEWVTKSEDCRHKHDILKKNVGQTHPLYGVVGSANPKAKKYIMTSPDGEEIAICGLAEFSRRHGLHNMQKVLRGELKHVRGWKCRKAE